MKTGDECAVSTWKIKQSLAEVTKHAFETDGHIIWPFYPCTMHDRDRGHGVRVIVDRRDGTIAWLVASNMHRAVGRSKRVATRMNAEYWEKQ
jgi:hypothetical protein